MSSEQNRQNEYRTHLEEMAAAYALGALDDPAERTYFEDLIAARDPLALELLGEMFGVSSELARAVSQTDAPSSVEQALLKKLYHVPKAPDTTVQVPQQTKPGGIAAIRNEKSIPAQRRAYVPMKLKPYIIGGSALVLMLVIAFSMRLLNQRGPDQETIAHLHTLTEERDSLRLLLTERSHADSLTHVVFQMMQEQSAEMVTLARSPQKDSCQHLLFSADQKLVIFMEKELPPAPSDKSYQLWQIAEGHTMSVGLIDDKQEGHVFDFPAPDKKAEGFALTLEDKGGSQEPKGPVLYAGVVHPHVKH